MVTVARTARGLRSTGHLPVLSWADWVEWEMSMLRGPGKEGKSEEEYLLPYAEGNALRRLAEMVTGAAEQPEGTALREMFLAAANEPVGFLPGAVGPYDHPAIEAAGDLPVTERWEDFPVGASWLPPPAVARMESEPEEGGEASGAAEPSGVDAPAEPSGGGEDRGEGESSETAGE